MTLNNLEFKLSGVASDYHTVVNASISTERQNRTFFLSTIS